ncbi:TPA: hypothetical protein ACG0EZ_004771 [Enterobacter ludwigii]|uniref:hypothetical protein n=1 Tax=Enterobacter kobei TaxID=208224 RepID=UPI002A818681|nr:hypothetical protein [Enterobacter kobei]
MSLDCIVFPQSGEPEKIQVREDNQDVSFLVDGNWQNRRVGRFSVTEPGKETVYLIAHGMDNKPSNSVIKAAIEKLQPKPYEIKS